MRQTRRLSICGLLVLELSLQIAFASDQPGSNAQFDVVVFGATPAGVVAAIAAAKEGARACVIESSEHIGGMLTSGLGRTDSGNPHFVGGMSREFFRRIGEHYHEDIYWAFEPHVASEVFTQWLGEIGVTVEKGHRLVKIVMEDDRIRYLSTTKRKLISAQVFIDATYEGDLLDAAGVSFVIGREGVDAYGESLAGIRSETRYHNFDKPIPAYDGTGSLLPLVGSDEAGFAGEGDSRIQAYNFRLCFSSNPCNQVAFSRPPAYDPRRFELLRRWLVANPEQPLDAFLLMSKLPNGKWDVNNRGPISTDFIGGSWAYPLADDAQRREIVEMHQNYTQGMLYFLANDPAVPDRVQRQIQKFGLARDEFVETENWPPQLYVREARRMVGGFVMTQMDLQERRTKRDSIGMGSHGIDSHNVRRFAVDGKVLNEGDLQIGVAPYEIPYRVLTPLRSQCRNLLVPVCVSASHVAFSSIRMEPVWMILGHAAGVAAAWAAKSGAAVQDVRVGMLQARLRLQGQILTADDSIPVPSWFFRSRKRKRLLAGLILMAVLSASFGLRWWNRRRHDAA